MGKRPRIKRDMGELVGRDELSFEKNVGTERARLAVTINYRLSFELWHHKHYWDRVQIGDDNGRREGIEPEAVRSLVSSSLSHLIYYACRVKTFSFLNVNSLSLVMIVLRDCYSQEKILNVPINVHFSAPDRFEITVMTAMRADDFYLRAGQYLLDFDSETSSTLKRFDQGKFVELCSYEQ